MPPPPYRADQIGSLIRPKYLLEANAASKQWLETERDHRPEADDVETKKRAKEAQQKAITEVVAEQVNRGIVPISSGEFERPVFFGGFFEAIDGLEVKFFDLSKFRTDFPTNRPLIQWGVRGRDAAVATGKMKLSRSPYLDGWLYIRSLLPEERWKDVKVTLPPPGWWHIQLKRENAFDPNIYGSDEDYLKDLSAAVRQEIMTLYDAGVRFVQIDDPNLTYFCDPDFIKHQEEEGVDLDTLLNLHIKSHNDAIVDLPSDLRVGVHLCRGNFPGGIFTSTGAYDRIASKLFHDLNYKLFYLEYDSDRAGDFTPLQHLPKDKAVVLGVVTTKSAEMEKMDELKARVLQAADIIAKGQGTTKEETLQNNIAVSPQCGFASSSDGSGIGMSEEMQWQKLELLQALAREIWR